MTNAAGLSDQQNVAIVVNATLAPIAELFATPTNGTAPFRSDFDASASVANATGGLTFAWQFGDGATAGNSPTVSHTYNAPGTYNAIVTVSNSAGLSDQQAVAIVVNAPPSGNCTLLAHESFDYPANAALHGRNGGFGFQLPWVVQNDNNSVPGYQTVSGSLSSGGLSVSGNHASGGTDFLSAGRRLSTDAGSPFANFIAPGSDAIGSATNGAELWLGVIIRKDTDDDSEVSLSLHSQDLLE
ncbi:MAG: PKD domain-containing protein [Saprospiraceae bacterium]